MTEKALIIVGISGITNSGKTSLTKKIKTHLPGCHTICQDTYFLEPPDPRLTPVPELDHYNFDELNALDMNTMISDVQSWIDAHSIPQESALDDLYIDVQNNSTPQESIPGDLYSNVLILDGFRMFALRELEQYMQKKYFLRVPYEVCKARRSSRHYTPPDKPGYFEKIVWPESITHQREIQDQDDIGIVRINISLSELYEENLHESQNVPTWSLKSAVCPSSQAKCPIRLLSDSLTLIFPLADLVTTELSFNGSSELSFLTKTNLTNQITHFNFCYMCMFTK